MIVEDVDRRAIAALRFVHGVTGAPIVRALQIESPGLTSSLAIAEFVLDRVRGAEAN